MQFERTTVLRNGAVLQLRNATYADGESVLRIFNETHAETDFLLSYPDENSMTLETERSFLQQKTESANEIEIIAIVDGEPAGVAGIEAVGSKYKIAHRADFGISVLKRFWGMGVGRALIEACVECAKAAGYTQLELGVVADNERAVAMYKKAGFIEFGRNPKGFRSRFTGYQALVYMRMELI